MTRRLPTKSNRDVAAPTVPSDAAAVRVHATSSSTLTQRRVRPQTREDVEERYVAARDAWTAAMRAANSGRPADLAALAIAQEAYEAAVAEREAWESGARVAIHVETDGEHRDLSAIVRHEMAWRKVRTHDEKPLGILGRIRRRLNGS